MATAATTSRISRISQGSRLRRGPSNLISVFSGRLEVANVSPATCLPTEGERADPYMPLANRGEADDSSAARLVRGTPRAAPRRAMGAIRLRHD